MKEKLFNASDDFVITQIMLKEGHLHRPFARIRKLIPHYKPKQIRNRWRDKLDPRLCHDPLDECEQQFIVQWISANSNPHGKISWIRLRYELERQFYKFRTENKLKNYWYSQLRQSRETAKKSSSNKAAISYLLNDDVSS